MKNIGLLLLLTCIIQVQGVVFEATSPGTTLDCSAYANDQEILATFPFSIPFLPWTDYSPTEYDKTSGRWDFFQRVYELVIVSENFIPSTIFCLRSLQNLYIRNSSFYTDNHDINTKFPIPSRSVNLLYDKYN
ncbi:unnamed protein product [Adineta ricciae]|uniref:Uncharacterized protein n=1 Tax=Adineta ricciae TaxID=249248 RepID=A0A816GPW1_ADIRI|nr:unnamed protein product [Adineta ricciae]